MRRSPLLIQRIVLAWLLFLAMTVVTGGRWPGVRGWFVVGAGGDSSQVYVYVPIGEPTIASILPSGHTADGETLTIGGTNYGSTKNAGDVYVGSSNATPPAEAELQAPISWSDTEIILALNDNASWSDGDSLYVMVFNADPDTVVSAFGRYFDEDGPDTSAYTPIAFDTTNTSDVAVVYASDATEAALWMVEYKRGVGGTWRPGTPAWHSDNTDDADTTFVTSLKDTIWTALSTATLDGDTFITRFAMKDSFQHVSSLYYPDTTVFTRAPLEGITFTLLPPSENGADARVGFVAYDDTASDYMVEFAYGPSVAWLDAAAYDTMIAYSGSPATAMADTDYTVGVNFCVTDTLFARLTKDNTAAGGSEYVVAVDTMVFDYTDIAPKSASKPGNDALLTGGILFIGDSDSLASADGTAGSGKMSYRQLALHDWVALHMGNLRIDAANAYNNQPVADSVRSYNPDFALTYFTYWWGMDPDWSSMADTSSYRQQWEYCGDSADDGDTSFALRDVDGDIIKWAADVTQWHQNPAGFYISGADTIWYYQRYADVWLDMLRHSGQYQDYVGITSDLLQPRPGPADLYDANLDSVDLDQDGTSFNDDASFYDGNVWGAISEKEAYALGTYKMCEYLKNQAWDTFIHIANGQWYDGRSDVGAIWHNVRTKMDGHNYEHANQYFPNTWTTFKQMMTEDDSTWASTLDWPILTWDEGNWTVSPLNGYYMGERILEGTAIAQGMYYTVRDSLQPSVTGKHWRWRFEEPDSTLFDAGVDTVANSLVWNDTDWIVSRTLKDSTVVQIHVWENETYPGYLTDGDCWHWVATDSNDVVVKQWPLTNNYFDPLTIEGLELSYSDTNASGYIVSADADTINPQAAVRFFTWHRDSAMTDTTGMAWSDTALIHALLDTANITYPIAEADSTIRFTWSHIDTSSTIKYHLDYQVDYGAWTLGDSNIHEDSTGINLDVPRGVIGARIAGVDASYDRTAWSYLYIDGEFGGYYDHQATEIYGKLHARSLAGDIVASSTLDYILTAYPAADVTAPDTSYIAPIAFDTTNTSNVKVVCTELEIDEDGLAQWQWATSGVLSYLPDPGKWHATNTDDADTTYGTVLRDTLATGMSTSELADSTVVVRVRAKDEAQNVSDWWDHNDTGALEKLFTRASAPAIVSITSTAKSLLYEGLVDSIIGTGFEASQGSGAVILRDTSAYHQGFQKIQSVDSWSNTLIVYTVEDSTMWANDDSLWVEVENNSASYDISDGVAFTRCYVASIYPAFTRIVAGDSVQILGGNFGATQGSGQVIVGTDDGYVPADSALQTIANWKDTQIKFALTADDAWVEGDSLYFKVWNDESDTNKAPQHVCFDEDAPDTTAYTPMAFDTTNTSDVALAFAATASEGALWRVVYKNGIAGTWAPADSAWHSDNTDDADTTYVTALKDTLATGASTAALAGDTIYSRFELKDEYGHVSSYFQPDTTIFTRATPAAGDTAFYVIGASSADHTISNDSLWVGDGDTGEELYSGYPIYEILDNEGTRDVYYALLEPENPTTVVAVTYDRLYATQPLPINSDDVNTGIYLTYFDVADVLSDSSVTEVIEAYLHVYNGTGIAFEPDAGGYMRVVVGTTALSDDWCTGTAGASNDLANACYSYADTTGSVAWTDSIGSIDATTDIGSFYSDRTDTLSITRWYRWGNLATGVDAWRTGSNEGGFWMYGDNNTASTEWYYFGSFSSGAKSPILVLKVVR